MKARPDGFGGATQAKRAGPGRPKGSKDRGVRGKGRVSAGQIAEAAAAANGAPPPADLAVKTTSIRAALERIDTHYSDAYLEAVVKGLNAKPPKSAPYVELVTRYRVGKPPDASDPSRTNLIFWLSKGAPGGYDPLALPPSDDVPAQVVEVTPVPPRRARPAPPPSAPDIPPPDDPDELVPLP